MAWVLNFILTFNRIVRLRIYKMKMHLEGAFMAPIKMHFLFVVRKPPDVPGSSEF